MKQNMKFTSKNKCRKKWYVATQAETSNVLANNLKKLFLNVIINPYRTEVKQIIQFFAGAHIHTEWKNLNTAKPLQ